MKNNNFVALDPTRMRQLVIDELTNRGVTVTETTKEIEFDFDMQAKISETLFNGVPIYFRFTENVKKGWDHHLDGKIRVEIGGVFNERSKTILRRYTAAISNDRPTTIKKLAGIVQRHVAAMTIELEQRAKNQQIRQNHSAEFDVLTKSLKSLGFAKNTRGELVLQNKDYSIAIYKNKPPRFTICIESSNADDTTRIIKRLVENG